MSKLSTQIIDLDAYREQRLRSQTSRALYFNQSQRCLGHLQNMGALEVELVQAPMTVTRAFSSIAPELVIIELPIHWADPLQLVECCHHKWHVPILLLCDPDSARNRLLLKTAYALGACDTLVYPCASEDLLETVDVLLKFNSQAFELH